MGYKWFAVIAANLSHTRRCCTVRVIFPVQPQLPGPGWVSEENSGLAQYCKSIGGQYLDQSGALVTDWEAISGPMGIQHLSILIGSCDCAQARLWPGTSKASRYWKWSMITIRVFTKCQSLLKGFWKLNFLPLFCYCVDAEMLRELHNKMFCSRWYRSNPLIHQDPHHDTSQPAWPFIEFQQNSWRKFPLAVKTCCLFLNWFWTDIWEVES